MLFDDANAFGPWITLRVTKAEVSNLERVYANLGLVPRDRQGTRQRPWETLWALGAFPDSAGHLL